MITLAMRNPQDAKPGMGAKELTRLEELGPTPPAPEPVVVEKPVYIDRPVPVQPVAAAETPKEEPRPKAWGVRLIKGGQATDIAFPMQKASSPK